MKQKGDKKQDQPGSSDGNTSSNNAYVRSYYKNPKNPGAYSGLQKLSKGLKIGRKTIQDILTEEETYTLHTPIRKKFKRRRVLTNGPGQQIQMDLIDVSHLKKQIPLLCFFR